MKHVASATSTGSRATVSSIFSDGASQGEGVTFFNAAKFAEGDKVWVKGNKETIWDMGDVIAAFKQSDNETVVIRTKGGREVVTNKVYGAEVVPVVGGKIGYSDMTAMKYVNEPQILENLRVRCENDRAYTFLGPVLVAVNPLKGLADEIEAGSDKVLQYSHPHAVAELAYQQMLFAVKRPDEAAESPTNQTVIVSGESGAGKTVSSKKVLNHLVARSGGGELAEAMLGSNPIMESFGNAQTLRNPNSSRFGKLLKVTYNEIGKDIIGAKVGTYLLERSRITTHELGERNYHIFYEMIQGADAKLLEKLHLSKGTDYKILLPHSKQESQAKMLFLETDAMRYKETAAALKTVGLDERRFNDLMANIASVLHLNNLIFEDEEDGGNVASKVNAASKNHLTWAAELLGVGAVDLEKTLCEVERKVGGQVIKSPVSSAQAEQLLDGVAKALYTRIFAYVVDVVNASIQRDSNDRMPNIGVLDIFGFETFQKNDIEQLLINYTNEALQLTFNKQVLEAEAALYQREKLAISDADRLALDPNQVIDQSNKLCIDLLQGVTLEKREAKKRDHLPGILDVIHEQGRVPGPTEKKMLERMHRTFGAKGMYPNYIIIKKEANKKFTIKHYAGKVKYTVGNFLLKNNDTLPKSTDDLFFSSTKEVTKAIWDCGPRLQGSKKASIVSTFVRQISKLSKDLNSTTCSFIRCIKPNAAMHRQTGWFDKKYITTQLRNLSIPKTADVLKAGLPTRIPYAQLVDNYKTIFGNKVRTPNLKDERGVKSFIAALFFAFEIPRPSYKLGMTKVFFKSGDLDKLDEVLASAEAWKKTPLDPVDEAERDIVIQRFKKYHIRRRWRVIFAYMFATQMFKKLHLRQKKRKEDMLKASILIQRQVRRYIARKKYAIMVYDKRLEDERKAREKAEAERKERERLAEEARQRELEKQRQLRAFLEEKKEREKQQKEKFAKMHANFRKANKEAADFKKKELELRRKEKERREEEERQRKEEAERQRLEIERLRIEREEEEKRVLAAAEEERKAKEAYEEKLNKLYLEEKEKKEKEQREKEGTKGDLVNNASYMQYIEGKLQRDQEKLEEKQVMEQVVDTLMAREEEKEDKEWEQEEEEKGDDENPWFFYEDLDLDDIDKISQGSEDEERVNEALRFLDNLGEVDSDDGEVDSDLESMEEERNFEIVKKADKGVTQASFKEYNGPYIVNVNIKKLEEVVGKKRFRLLRGLTTWKQCFAFVYPSHQRVMLHHGVDNMMKIEFNPPNSSNPAMLRNTSIYNRKKNVVYVTGVKLSEKDDPKSDVSRDLIVSFQDMDKREHFIKLIKHFVLDEEELQRKQAKSPAPPTGVAKVEKGRRVSETLATTVGRVQTMKQRHERRDALRQQNYTKFALLNQAVKEGKLKKERVQELLLQNEDDDDEDEYAADLTMCVKCSKTVQVTDAICQHCGAPQRV